MKAAHLGAVVDYPNYISRATKGMGKKALIGGGTGFIGRRLGNYLATKGYDVVNVSRMPGVNNISWTTLTGVGLPDKTDAVVNLAGQQTMDFTKLWSSGFKQNIINSRVFTTKTLAQKINESENKPQCFVVVTGVGAYEPSTEKVYDEDSVVRGTDFFSDLCLQWEAAAREVNKPVRLVIIRSGVVLGRWGGMIKNMFMPFYFGLGGRLGSGKQYLPWIHIDDLVRLIAFSIKNPKVEGVINGVAPHVITNEEFTKAFAKAMRRPAFVPVPEIVLNALLHSERAMLLTKGQHVIPKRANDYGFNYLYPNIDTACKNCTGLLPKEPPMPKEPSM